MTSALYAIDCAYAPSLQMSAKVCGWLNVESEDRFSAATPGASGEHVVLESLAWHVQLNSRHFYLTHSPSGDMNRKKTVEVQAIVVSSLLL